MNHGEWGGCINDLTGMQLRLSARVAQLCNDSRSTNFPLVSVQQKNTQESTQEKRERIEADVEAKICESRQPGLYVSQTWVEG